MRLLKFDQDDKVTLTEDLLNEDAMPPYAILSHTWGEEEVTFDELTNGNGTGKVGYRKIQFCMQQAKSDGFQHSWVDTCCINKADHTELQHAINSMFRWYKNSAVCYVYLSDVSTIKRKADSDPCRSTWEPMFRCSRWFKRGWTLQELLAPRRLDFYSREEKLLGNSHGLIDTVHSITNLPTTVLEGASLDGFSIEERLDWTKNRTTTREEDRAYSLLGLFGIFMPLLYGEGERNAFRRLQKEVQKQRHSTQACIQSLSYPEQEHRHNDIHRAVETCGWLLQDSKFNLWLGKQHGILWIKGDPGSGKSVLMKHAVRSAKIQFPNELVVPYFVHGQGSELQRTSIGVYRALLNSLLSHFPVCLAKLATIFEDRESRFGGYSAGRWSWSSNELQEFLTDLLINHTQQHQVTIFVDALDECGEGPARELMAYFGTLTEQAGPREAKVRICLSSRYYPILGIDDLPSISVEERNHEDIKWFVNDRLRTFGTSPTRQKVLEEIMSKAQGGFQWALLVTELIIDRKFSGKRVLGQVASCPSTLSDFYASLLNDGTEMEKRQAIKLFRWIIFARRPMSAQELREALFTDHDMLYTSVTELRNHEEWSETMEDFQRYVTYISKGLVKFEARDFWEQWEESGHEAQLIHQSVADFLVKDFLTDEGMNSACAGHYLISRSCLKYLTLRDIPGRCPQQRARMSSEFPLAPYAVRYVFDHIRSVEEAGLVQSDLLSALKWSPWSESMSQLIIVWKTLNPNGLGTPSGWPFVRSSELHVLAALGSQSAFMVSLQQDPGALHRRDLYGNTPLHIALSEGHTGVVALLLNNHSQWKEPDRNCVSDALCETTSSSSQGAQTFDLDAQNEEGETPLDIATTMMANTAVLNLLRSGASIQCMNQPSLLLLHAIGSEDITLLKKLIASHANLEGSIRYAVMHDSSLEIFQELLKAYSRNERLEIDENSGPDQYRYKVALHLACYHGLKQKVSLLLEHGASATTLNEEGECPLQAAVAASDESYDERLDDHIEIIQTLLRHAPFTVESRNRNGSTALDDAVRYSRENFIRILLKKGQFSSPSSTLTRMFMSGDVFNSLCHELEIEDLEIEGPGELAALMSMIEKINPYLRDSERRTVLWYAAANGRKDITEELIKRGAVINMADEDGTSPLQVAIRNGHSDVAKILRSAPCIDFKAISRRLTTAISDKRLRVTQPPLGGQGIDVEIMGEDGVVRLLTAIKNEHTGMTWVFLDREDVFIEAQDIPGVSSFFTALRACQSDESGRSLILLNETLSSQNGLAQFYNKLVMGSVYPMLTQRTLADSCHQAYSQGGSAQPKPGDWSW